MMVSFKNIKDKETTINIAQEKKQVTDMCKNYTDNKFLSNHSTYKNTTECICVCVCMVLSTKIYLKLDILYQV